MAKRGTLFVISGPAGAGKSEIVKTVLKAHPDIRLSVSCTTRSPRPGEIDVQGCRNVVKQRPDTVSIFVSPPSRDNLEKRLRDRGTETEESIRVRLGNVAKEVAEAYKYQYVIIHRDWSEIPDALTIAANEVYAIISAKHCEESARKDFLDELSAQLRG